MVLNFFAKFSMLLTIENFGPFFHDFLIQNVLVVPKNVLIQKYAGNIEFCQSKKKLNKLLIFNCLFKKNFSMQCSKEVPFDFYIKIFKTMS